MTERRTYIDADTGLTIPPDQLRRARWLDVTSLRDKPDEVRVLFIGPIEWRHIFRGGGE